MGVEGTGVGQSLVPVVPPLGWNIVDVVGIGIGPVVAASGYTGVVSLWGLEVLWLGADSVAQIVLAAADQLTVHIEVEGQAAGS